MDLPQDALMLIMQADPEAPGMHGKTEVGGAPDRTADQVLIQIRDLITDFLDNAQAPEKPDEEKGVENRPDFNSDSEDVSETDTKKKEEK